MTTMPQEKLLKILNHEADECQDQAMHGGLARYAETWIEEAIAHFGPQAQAWVHEVADSLRHYSTLNTTEEREIMIMELLRQVKAGPHASSTAPQSADPPTRTELTNTHSSANTSSESRATSPANHRELDSDVTALQGVGSKYAERLHQLGVATIRDLLYLFPRRYDDYSQLLPINRLELGEEVTIIGQVRAASERSTRSGLNVFKATLDDGSGRVDVTWFNQKYLSGRIKPGDHIVVSGKVCEYLGRLCFNSPEWEHVDDELLHTARIVPVYPLTEGLRARWLRSLMKRTVDYWALRLPDHLPSSIRAEADLVDLEQAIAQIHFPDTMESLNRARHRLAFDELFIMQIGLLQHRDEWRSTPGRPVPINDVVLQDFLSGLPFQLTQAQQRVLNEIVSDLRSDKPMNRLLQGDVGSGKTIVAASAILLTAGAGYQACLMAPTGILAEQHFETLSRLFEQAPIQPTVRLLTSSITGQERDEISTKLERGEISVIVGTHALIQASVAFRDLALVVIDEQHRFGVEQRTALRQKGYNPHTLTMSATPIPRSLALTIWGHLDVSTIDEMPAGRQPILTRVIMPYERERAYGFVRSQVAKGHQAFVICPLIEESDKIEATAAVEEYERLQREIFPSLRIGLLHGKLRNEDKERIMEQFTAGELDILVATAVVEVGIDVPNATVMMIEGAERFGLAQLHQFRGRVGRGSARSYCLLISESSQEQATERLKAVESIDDGFALAQKDLELRGPGEFLGTRQAGLPQLRLAQVTNLPLVEAARGHAQRLFEVDSRLEHPDNRLLARRVIQFWSQWEKVD
ncbi:MAG: ATP-dependent DNA helicase RecG [Chloroflexi bacterium]|nr:ATP-dependent DNA helicase RecG [Chloroflexota bacterium]